MSRLQKFGLLLGAALLTAGCMMRHVTVRKCKDVKHIFTSHHRDGGNRK